MTAEARPRSARLEARIAPELEALIEAAARITHGGNKSAFVTDALHEAALKATARVDVTYLDPAVFDRMIASLDQPDDSAELDALVAARRDIAW